MTGTAGNNRTFTFSPTPPRTAAPEALRVPVYATIRPVWQRIAKRAGDFVGGLLLLVLCTPAMLVIAAIVKLTSPGPVFYAGKRMGKDGQIFACVKFRTMRPDADALQAQLEAQNEAQYPIFKIARDPRVTPFGRWLRATSLDELPQLFNVLRGEMSLVGPRPLPLRDCALLSSADHRRHSMLPGMTGLWQIAPERHSSDSESDIVTLDLAYVDGWSLLGDLWILLQTVGVVAKSLTGRESNEPS